MRIIDQELQIPDFSYPIRLKEPHTLYIDIETTGLNRRRSHLYLLGAMYIQNDQPCLRQWFAEKPSDEENILRDFFSFCGEFTRLIQFNGTNFDLPYLCHKATFYDIDPFTLPSDVTDLYQLYRPLKKILSQPDMKLTTLESATGYLRTDQHSGKELISVYETWLQTADETLLATLRQHNTDDIIGMLWLERLDALLSLRRKELEPDTLTTRIDNSSGYLICTCQYTLFALPKLTIQEDDGLRLTAQADTLTLTLPVYGGTLYHYFDDYKNYYYFPDENRALHKSIAIYAEASSRIKATKETAYEPHTGQFLRTFAPLLDTPMFQTPNREKNLWFIPYDQTTLTDIPRLTTYVMHIISALLSR